jgi:hypothetical protein
MGEERAVVREYRDRVAQPGGALDALDGAGEDPRVAMAQRLLAPRLDDQAIDETPLLVSDYFSVRDVVLGKSNLTPL